MSNFFLNDIFASLIFKENIFKITSNLVLLLEKFFEKI